MERSQIVKASSQLRPPAITDVAELAGVSHQTVSRVLNKHPNVRPATRARVLAAIAELGYRPNNAARALATGRSQTLGVVALDVADWSGLTTLYGIERSAREAGYFVSIANLESVDRASMRSAINRLAEQAVAGVLIIAPIAAAADALTVLPADLPVVAIEGDPAETDVALVTTNQVEGARAATAHLLELGHETVFHMAGPREWRQSDDRIAGWRAALEDADAEVPVPIRGDWSARSGYEIGQTLARIPELTSVFAANDQMALGLLRALSERGLRVPGDIAIVGFDDLPETEFYTPPLTTVRQDFHAVGREGLELLLGQLEAGSRSSDRRVVGCDLIVRASTAAPAPRGRTR